MNAIIFWFLIFFIFVLFLAQKETLSDDVNIELIAASIDGFTGSDIREICRLASISRMKAILLEKKNRSKEKSHAECCRPFCQVDFDRAITKTLEDGILYS
jgi:SpoVK/Ycf46/Vps4 family AAA+-type ATPase